MRVPLALVLASAALFTVTLSATGPLSSTPSPTSLLLQQADLPSGFISDDALENADATARVSAYAPLINASAFSGYRAQDGAIVQALLRLRRRADTAILLAHEAAAIDRARNAERITLSTPFGDGITLAYQQNGSHGEEWVVGIFSRGPFVTSVGAYEAAGEQQSINLLQQVATIADTRLEAAARLTPDISAPRQNGPFLRIVSFTTMTARQKNSDHFSPHSTVYWRVTWSVGTVARGMRETLREKIQLGRHTLFADSVTDTPYSGDNTLSDHFALKGAASGRYTITFSVSIGRQTVSASHDFVISPTSSKP